ncbi:DoxX family protein [Calidifontibacillus erzurumensis]|uniref:DoxX family protein n=1 Tax=Calidifontibacillus erzurumensis TaxID=2741433 RepID=A0A8J8GEA9_9BACI|nr:DoxX family protein [Calidifontibacillus erzurumensis]NSL50823.1 DoxX family protein [Calidifontibacillus erzurumensis]
MNKYEVGTLLLRVFLGFTFFMHGLAKFQVGIENIAGWFTSIGLPSFLAYVVSFIELAGGIALILGLGTRIVSALLALIMIGATFKVKLAAGFLGNGQGAGYELDLALLVMAIFILINGSKLYALDQIFFKSQNQNSKAA